MASPAAARLRHFLCKAVRRFVSALVFSILIVVVLHVFQGKGKLSNWDKRGFNTLTILFSSLVSLLVGSLLGLLGGMIRWRLLAWNENTPLDVDLILVGPNPGTPLIPQRTPKGDSKRCSDGRPWATTLIVALYLLINVVGRLSVAAFGLAYSLNEIPGIDYPVKVTDWSSKAWLDEEGIFYGPAFNGNIGIEYIGLEDHPSKDNVLHSSARCTARTIYGTNIYEKGIKVGTLLNLWAARVTEEEDPDPSGCSTTYLFSNDGFWEDISCEGTLYECTTCLSDQDNKSAAKTLPFQNYPAASSTTSFNDGIYDEDNPSTNVPSYSEVHAAHLAARLPILTIIGAETQLPRRTKVEGAPELPMANIVLDVKWQRVWGVLGAMLGGQLLVIVGTFWWCREIILPDHDSYLPIARLLRTAMQNTDGRSVATGWEFAAQMAGENMRMKYGTRTTQDGSREVDLWDDVDGEFPEARYR
ncbi:hypothetical protein MFIFM68171_02269 [Madurella fahalii]|uniref:C-type lectin domain-containing protein n=1 Tax=Madurella fahalii TaxID=1157608 RepID=A0ABQ0G2Z7_9PEZI